MARLALLVVDVQKDFCPGGNLAVKNGDRVVPKLNMVVGAFSRARLPIFFSRDWHPSNHLSFKPLGGIWPPHCIMGTTGAEFHQDLKIPPGSVIISKAMDPDLEAYSAFQGTDLADQLSKMKVDEVFIGGLTTDYCVRESSLDAMASGFTVNVMKDCIQGVNLKRNDSTLALAEIVERGARLVTSGEAIRRCQRAAMKSSS